MLIGSGDHDHPFGTAVIERFYMVKDHATGAPPTDSSGNPLYPTITESSL